MLELLHKMKLLPLMGIIIAIGKCIIYFYIVETGSMLTALKFSKIVRRRQLFQIMAKSRANTQKKASLLLDKLRDDATYNEFLDIAKDKMVFIYSGKNRVLFEYSITYIETIELYIQI
jgi:hypothetical protein